MAWMSRSSGSWKRCRNATLSRTSWEGRKIEPYFPPFCSDLGQEIPLEMRQHPLPSQPAEITGTGSVLAAGTPKRALCPVTRSSLWPHSTATRGCERQTDRQTDRLPAASSSAAPRLGLARGPGRSRHRAEKQQHHLLISSHLC